MANDDSLQILDTDAMSGLRTLADNTVQVALTSPPFYLLRRYGTAVTWTDGWIGELGHEPHPNDFVRHLVHIFDEVWRILRDDGCLADDRPHNLWRVNPEASPYRHVAMWPRELVRQMLLPTTRPGDTVLDPFAGSGTTGEVALDLGRKVILIESSPRCQEALTARLHGLSRSLAL